ncbi:unnamed protein product [Trifolium pratense]|uniref:Uncharacterized protein n=1 Tax=Trifolium pratense TaxID=57577 RepID=A0ACB0J5P7_TRIPR|nr:unnamed protein product [Trifolium pratense]
MKLSTPTQTPTSSNVSPSISSNTPMCSSKTTTTGCLTAIMRKILCSGNLPKDPSKQLTEFDSTNSVLSYKDHNLHISEENAMAAAATPPPPIVARLMGLESMGEIPFASKPGSLSRSKSMNSMDYLGESNGKIHHQRVSSTLSFREPPTFKLTENESFFVLNFENEGESVKGLKSKSKSNGRKKQMGCSELKLKDEKMIVDLKEKKNKRENVYDEKVLIEKGKMSKRVSNKLLEITNTSYKFKGLSEKKCYDSEAVELLKPKSYNEVVISEKKKRRIRRKKRTNFYAEKKIETECKSDKSDDSSPVSVLEFERKSCGTGIDSIAVGLSSRRKLTPELENNKHILMRSDDNLMIDEKKDKAIEESKKREKHNYKEYIDIWGEACKLVEDELAGSKNQVHAWMNQESNLGSVCADFESEIFDQLLNEVISQLVE